MWVTFDSHVDADVNFIEVSNLDTSTLIPGTLHPNPAFDVHAPDPNDVAVITFETPVEGIIPAVLPTPGLLDDLGQQNGLKDQLFTVVGYGVNQRIVGEGPPTLVRDLNRRFATSRPQCARASDAASLDEHEKGLWRRACRRLWRRHLFGPIEHTCRNCRKQGRKPGFYRATVSIPRWLGRSSPTSPLLFRTRWCGLRRPSTTQA